jgi:hypothetical protein
VRHQTSTDKSQVEGKKEKRKTIGENNKERSKKTGLAHQMQICNLFPFRDKNTLLNPLHFPASAITLPPWIFVFGTGCPRTAVYHF